MHFSKQVVVGRSWTVNYEPESIEALTTVQVELPKNYELRALEKKLRRIPTKIYPKTYLTNYPPARPWPSQSSPFTAFLVWGPSLFYKLRI